MQQNKRRVLSTRPLSKEVARIAALNNIQLDEIAFIETTDVESDAVKEAIKEKLAKEITVVFTSMNAVEAVARYAGQIPQWKIFSIGNATKQLMAASFGSEKIIATAPNAAELAKVIIEKQVKEITFFCGDQRREELPGILGSHGIKVNEIIVYRTIATPVALDSTYDGILFFSPSAVRSFFSVNKVPLTTILFAIGQTTAGETGLHAGGNTIVVPLSPAKVALMEEVIRYFNPGA